MNKPEILVVDDNPANQMVANALAGRYGFDVVSARSGNEALVLINERGQPFDAVLMDVNMPIMNGIECAKALNEFKAKRNWQMPIIGVSAHSSQSCRKQCLEAGMDDYIEKPFAPEEFKTILSKWTSGDANLRSIRCEDQNRESA